MKQTVCYKVAGITIAVSSNNPASELLDGFEQFISKSDKHADLTFVCSDTDNILAETIEYATSHTPLKSFDFSDSDTTCSLWRMNEELIFRMIPTDDVTFWFKAYKQDGSYYVISNWDNVRNLDILRFALWMAFAICATEHNAIPIHSSVNIANGKAYMFLGESGTGKSTHTRLWRQNIDNVELLNDDSPIIKITDNGQVVVYGSPWSGKTPCYKNKCFPVGAIIRLSQAPHNIIKKLSVFESISALYPSCPPAFAKDETLTDKICATLNVIIAHTSIYHLDCLPNADAALLCYDTVTRQTHFCI